MEEKRLIREYTKAFIRDEIKECDTIHSKAYSQLFRELKNVFSNSNGENIYDIFERQTIGSNWMSILKRKNELNTNIEINGQYNNIDFNKIIDNMIDEQIDRKKETYDEKVFLLSIINIETEEDIYKTLEYFKDFKNINTHIEMGFRDCIFDEYNILKAIRENRI